MGDVVQPAQTRGRRERAARRRGAAPAFFYFDLACPFSYLAAERVERLFARVVWRPVLGEGIHHGDPWANPLRATAVAPPRSRWRPGG
jgi:2-hydroxychromene-2-carboxylate isomerase